jgi:hypothetical protein
MMQMTVRLNHYWNVYFRRALPLDAAAAMPANDGASLRAAAPNRTRDG